jgi:hypothetical protein
MWKKGDYINVVTQFFPSKTFTDLLTEASRRRKVVGNFLALLRHLYVKKAFSQPISSAL